MRVDTVRSDAINFCCSPNLLISWPWEYLNHFPKSTKESIQPRLIYFCSKLARGVPTSWTFSTHMASIFIDHDTILLGIPTWLSIDNRTKFISKFFAKTCGSLGLKYEMTMKSAKLQTDRTAQLHNCYKPKKAHIRSSTRLCLERSATYQRVQIAYRAQH